MNPHGNGETDRLPTLRGWKLESPMDKICQTSLHRPLRELLVTKGPHEHILVFRIYLDESGHSKDPKQSVVAMGGCIAPLRAWERFEQEWGRVLHDEGVPELHMRHFAHSVGEFEGWTEERRRSFLSRLLTIIEHEVDVWVGALLPLSQFEELTPEQKQRLGDPYFICLQDCLEAALRYVDSLKSSESLQVVIAMHQEHTREAYGAVIAFARHLPLGERLESITAAKPRTVLPLQSADLVAYELTKMGNLMLEPVKQPLRYPIERLKPKCFSVEFYNEVPLSSRV